jgi:hypothetical protein
MDFETFKRLQLSLVENLRECRDAQLELTSFIENHIREAQAGIGVEIENGHLNVSNDIEPKLNRLFKDFFSKARIALYHLLCQKMHPESVTYFLLGYALSFVQAKTGAEFEKGAVKFLPQIPGEKARALVDLLRGERATWGLMLIGIRDRITPDIDCPRLRMNYRIESGETSPLFPTVDRQELRQYLNLFWENLYQAVEEIVLLCIAIRMPDWLVPCRIPGDKIDPKTRFRWCFVLDHNRTGNSSRAHQ